MKRKFKIERDRYIGKILNSGRNKLELKENLEATLKFILKNKKHKTPFLTFIFCLIKVDFFYLLFCTILYLNALLYSYLDFIGFIF